MSLIMVLFKAEITGVGCCCRAPQELQRHPGSLSLTLRVIEDMRGDVLVQPMQTGNRSGFVF